MDVYCSGAHGVVGRVSTEVEIRISNLDLVGSESYAHIDGGCTRVLVVVCVCASHSLGAGNSGIDRFDDGLGTTNEGRSRIDGDHVGGAEADGGALDGHAY